MANKKQVIIGKGRNSAYIYNQHEKTSLTLRYDDDFPREYYLKYHHENPDISKLPPIDKIGTSIQDYENILMDNKVLNCVSFLGYNLEEVKLFYQSIISCISYFPSLSNYIHYFGSKSGFYDKMNQLNDDKIASRLCLDFIPKKRRDDFKEFFIQYVKWYFIQNESMMGSNIYGTAHNSSRFTRYAFIDENDLTKQSVKEYYKKKFFDEPNSLCSTVAFVAVHEIMHMLDWQYSLTTHRYEVMQFLSNIDTYKYKDEIRSDYMTKAEMFADTMARYICSNKKTPIASKLFDIVCSIANEND